MVREKEKTRSYQNSQLRLQSLQTKAAIISGNNKVSILVVVVEVPKSKAPAMSIMPITLNLCQIPSWILAEVIKAMMIHSDNAVVGKMCRSWRAGI